MMNTWQDRKNCEAKRNETYMAKSFVHHHGSDLCTLTRINRLLHSISLYFMQLILIDILPRRYKR